MKKILISLLFLGLFSLFGFLNICQSATRIEKDNFQFSGSVAFSNTPTVNGSTVLTATATNTLWISTTNLVTAATNGLWISTTNLVTGATNTLWISTTNLVTGTSNSLVSTINSATNTLRIFTTNLVTTATNGLWISTTNLVTGYVSTNAPKFIYGLTNESDTLATVLGRSGSGGGQSATNLGGLSSTGVVDLASKSGITNSPSRITVSDQLLANLDGGTFLGRENITRTRELTNVGETWTAKGLESGWYSVSISSDGKYQTAVVYGGQIYVSADYGQTWAAKDSLREWYWVSISSDGKYQTAVVVNGQIYVSVDYGQTWAAKDSNRNWYSVSISSDGKYQTAVVYGGQIYVSADYGQTWAAKDSNRNWRSISISSDGKYQTAVVYGEKIYISVDYGQTWAAKDSNRNWRSLSISSDGKYQTAVVYGEKIYISVDYGQTWAAKDSNRDWYSVSISSDGKYQTAVVFNNGQIYVSVDYGQTWAAKDSTRFWSSVSLSSDGKYQTAVADSGQIYVSVADEVMRGNLLITNGTVTAGGGFYGSAAGLTNFPVNVVQTNQTEYFGAPVVISNDVNNTTNLTVTSPWSLTNTYFYTILNTCQVTWAISGWPSTRQAELMISMHCESNVNNHVLPTGALRLNNGTFTATAPSIRSNAVMLFIHSPQQYWYMCATNDALIGTP